MQKSLDNGLQSTSQAVCQFFEWIQSLAKRLHWGSNPKSSLHTSLQQQVGETEHNEWYHRTFGVCLNPFYFRSMVTANKARVGGGGGEAPVGIHKGIRDCKV